VLVGLVVCIRTITLLRWVTQELRDDLVETAVAVIERRNRQQRMLSVAAVFVIAASPAISAPSWWPPSRAPPTSPASPLLSEPPLPGRSPRGLHLRRALEPGALCVGELATVTMLLVLEVPREPLRGRRPLRHGVSRCQWH